MERSENHIDNYQALQDTKFVEAIQVSWHKQGNNKTNIVALDT